MASPQRLDVRALEQRPVIPLPSGDGFDWSQAPVAELVAHIQSAYHRPLEAALPVLVQLARTVYEVHSVKQPEETERLRTLLDTLLALQSELMAHMAKEEEAFFPMVLAGHGADGAGLIGMLEEDHTEAKVVLAELRALTGDYIAPEGACTTWRVLWKGLAELEAAMFAHIRLEDEVLQPRVMRGR